MTDDPAVLRIGEVSRRTGVAVPTLRAWERRYELLEPHRTDGGHRLYRERDLQRVRDMQRLLNDGWSAAAAAREVIREPATITQLRPVVGDGQGADDASATLIERLDDAIARFDGPAAELTVDDVFARFEIPRALDEVLLPVLRNVGEGWEHDPRLIAREHFATNILRPRLQRLLRTHLGAGRRSCLAVAPEGEEHDLGLLAASVVSVDAGWRLHYLGSRMPSAALERSVVDLRPDVVLIGAVFREHAQRFLDERPDLGSAAVVLGGTGFVPDDADALPGAVVHEGPISGIPASLDRAIVARGAAM